MKSPKFSSCSKQVGEMIKETFDGLPLIAGVKTGSEKTACWGCFRLYGRWTHVQILPEASLCRIRYQKGNLLGSRSSSSKRIHNSAADIFQCCNKRLNLIGSDLFFNHGSYIGFKFVRYKNELSN